MSVMSWRDRWRLLGPVLGDVLPHDVEYGSAYQAVLDGAGKQKRTGILDQRAHDVRTPTLEHVVRTLETASDPGVMVLVLVAVTTEM